MRAKIEMGDELYSWSHEMPGLVSAAGAAVGAVGFGVWGAVAASSELFGPTLRHTSLPKKLALTFDDGPNPAVTPRLLDLLDRHSAHATFFLIGKFVRECPAIVNEISARGHLLGNHTDTHPNLIFHSRAGMREELTRCQDAIAAATHKEPPKWMRPPYGYRSPMLNAEIHRAGLDGVVMWSKICWDWKPQPPARLIDRLARVASPGNSHGDIVLLHDGDHRILNADRSHVIAALEHWLPRWRDAAIEFVTIDSK